jgi:hypothetical protein
LHKYAIVWFLNKLTKSFFHHEKYMVKEQADGIQVAQCTESLAFSDGGTAHIAQNIMQWRMNPKANLPLGEQQQSGGFMGHSTE